MEKGLPWCAAYSRLPEAVNRLFVPSRDVIARENANKGRLRSSRACSGHGLERFDISTNSLVEPQGKVRRVRVAVAVAAAAE